MKNCIYEIYKIVHTNLGNFRRLTLKKEDFNFFYFFDFSSNIRLYRKKEKLCKA